MELPHDVIVSNLGESVWGNAARKLEEDLATGTKEKTLRERLEALEQSFQEHVKEHHRFKRQFARNLCMQQKLEAINHEQEPLRTNAWMMGDVIKIRAPEQRKRKKKNKRKIV